MTGHLGLLLSLAVGPSAHAHTIATIDAGRGPVQLMIPDGYVKSRPVPLIISLHGFGGSGQSYLLYWQRNGQVDKGGFIMAAPTGTTDSKGRAFWNATDACCNKDHTDIDDAGYLRRLIEAIEGAYAIDPASIHITGYSNGGFMAHKMACEHADKVASIVSVAGAGFSNPEDCTPTGPVSVLQVHGLEDPIIRYDGGTLQDYSRKTQTSYPGALASVQAWVIHNGAKAEPTEGPLRDFSSRATGDDTRVIRFEGGQGSAELWAIAGEGHVPRLSDAFHQAVTDWMLSRPKAPNQ